MSNKNEIDLIDINIQLNAMSVLLATVATHEPSILEDCAHGIADILERLAKDIDDYRANNVHIKKVSMDSDKFKQALANTELHHQQIQS